jgi:hypothetical protein
MQHTVTFQLTPDEAKRARQALHDRLDGGTPAATLITLVIVLASWLSVGAFRPLLNRYVPLYAEASLPVGLSTILLLGYAMIRVRALSAFVTATATTTVQLSDVGIKTDGPRGSGRRTWESVRRIADSTEFFIL